MIVEVAIGSVAVVTVAALRFARWVIEYEEGEEEVVSGEDPKLYPWTHPDSEDELRRYCPICGSPPVQCVRREYVRGVLEDVPGGVSTVPRACPGGKACRVRSPHLHAHCSSCKSDFLTKPRSVA